MGQMCYTLKAAERAKALEQELWAANEAEWGKEKVNLLEAYEKCRQGLERAVHKLRMEKEKHAACEKERQSIRMRQQMRGQLRTGQGPERERPEESEPSSRERAILELPGKPAGPDGYQV